MQQTDQSPAPDTAQNEAAIAELTDLMAGKLKSLEKVLQNLRADNQALKQKVTGLEAKLKTAEQKLEAKTQEMLAARQQWQTETESQLAAAKAQSAAAAQQAPQAVLEIVKNSNLTLNSLTAEQSAELKNQVAHLIQEIDACLRYLND